MRVCTICWITRCSFIWSIKIEVKLGFLMCSWELDYKSSVYHICTRKRWRFPVEFSFCNVQNISWKIMFQELVATVVKYHRHLVIEECWGHGSYICCLLRTVAAMATLCCIFREIWPVFRFVGYNFTAVYWVLWHGF